MKSLVIILLVSCLAVSITSAASVRSSLRKSLFSSYDKLVNPDSQVSLAFALSVLDLGFCPHKQELQVRGWARNIWRDPRLTWKPADWGGVKSLSLPTTELWMPDLALYNSVSQTEPNYVSWEKTSRVLVFSDGKVVFVPPVTFRSFCKAAAPPSSNEDRANTTESEGNEDSSNTHNCSLKFGSWVHNKEVLDISPDTSQGGQAIDVSRIENTRVTIVSTDVARTEPEYPCCPGDKYPLLEFKIEFKSSGGGGHGGWMSKMMKSHGGGKMGSGHRRGGGHHEAGKRDKKGKKNTRGVIIDTESSEEEAEGNGEHGNL